MKDDDFQRLLLELDFAQAAFIRHYDQMPKTDWAQYISDGCPNEVWKESVDSLRVWQIESARLHREVQRLQDLLLQGFREAKTAHRKQEWGQEPPQMQLMAILSGIHGWAHNLETGVSQSIKAGPAIADLVDRAREVVEMLPELIWDSPPFGPEKEI